MLGRGPGRSLVSAPRLATQRRTIGVGRCTSSLRVRLQLQLLGLRGNMDITESFLYKQVLHGDDVGTRLSHMMQLQDLWSTAYSILTRPDLYHTPLEDERAKQLGIALDLLQHHMESEYNLVNYAKTINDLPKGAKDIT
jgi:hypothetical protein